MKAEYEETARGHLKSFTFLKMIAWWGCGLSVIACVILTAMGHSKANNALGGAAICFIFAFIFSNAVGFLSNSLSIIDLQKRVSELETGSPKDSTSQA